MFFQVHACCLGIQASGSIGVPWNPHNFWKFRAFSVYFEKTIFMGIFLLFLLISRWVFQDAVFHTKTWFNPPLCGLGIVKNDPPGWIYHCSSQPTNAIAFQQPEQRAKDVKSEISWGWFVRYTVNDIKLHSQVLNNISVFQLKSRFNWHRSRNQQCFSTNSSYQTHIKKNRCVQGAVQNHSQKWSSAVLQKHLPINPESAPPFLQGKVRTTVFEQQGIRNVSKNNANYFTSSDPHHAISKDAG